MSTATAFLCAKSQPPGNLPRKATTAEAIFYPSVKGHTKTDMGLNSEYIENEEVNILSICELLWLAFLPA